MTRKLKLGVVQMSMTDQLEVNVSKAITMVREAASQGAGLILLPELFENLYWCQVQRESYFDLANPSDAHPFIPRFQNLAKELQVVLPVSFFEKAGHAHYNSLAMIDSSGEVLGVYRKSHIPDGPGYMEKYYFNPGDTGFKAFQTHPGGGHLNAMVGAGICWDPNRLMRAARTRGLCGNARWSGTRSATCVTSGPRTASARKPSRVSSRRTTAVHSSRITPGKKSRRPERLKRPCWWRNSTSRAPAVSAPDSGSSGIADRSCTVPF
jgi:hypothetical protein